MINFKITFRHENNTYIVKTKKSENFHYFLLNFDIYFKEILKKYKKIKFYSSYNINSDHISEFIIYSNNKEFIYLLKYDVKRKYSYFKIIVYQINKKYFSQYPNLKKFRKNIQLCTIKKLL